MCSLPLLLYIKSDLQIPTAEGPDPVGRSVRVLALHTHAHTFCSQLQDFCC